MDLLQSYKALKISKKISKQRYNYAMNNFKSLNPIKTIFVVGLYLKIQADISNKMNYLKPILARRINKIEFLIN